MTTCDYVQYLFIASGLVIKTRDRHMQIDIERRGNAVKLTPALRINTTDLNWIRRITAGAEYWVAHLGTEDDEEN